MLASEGFLAIFLLIFAGLGLKAIFPLIVADQGIFAMSLYIYPCLGLLAVLLLIFADQLASGGTG